MHESILYMYICMYVDVHTWICMCVWMDGFGRTASIYVCTHMYTHTSICNCLSM